MAEAEKTEKQAKAEVEAAKEALAEAQQRALDAQQGLAATVTQGLPPIKVEVLPNNTISHDGKNHTEGDVVELDGPTAIAMVQAGHAQIKGA